MRYQLPITIIWLLTGIYSGICFAQPVSITRIKAIPSAANNPKQDSAIVYPVFHFKNTAVAERINAVIKKDFVQGYTIPDTVTQMATLLQLAAKQGLVQLNYRIAREDTAVLSVVMTYATVGAYASKSNNYYCFNKKTGGLLTLDSLINPIMQNNFMQLLRKKQQVNIAQYKNQLRLRLKNKQVDRDSYNYIIDLLKPGCMDNYDPKKFILYANTLEVILDCNFPQAIQSLHPNAVVKFSAIQLNRYLNADMKR